MLEWDALLVSEAVRVELDVPVEVTVPVDADDTLPELDALGEVDPVEAGEDWLDAEVCVVAVDPSESAVDWPMLNDVVEPDDDVGLNCEASTELLFVEPDELHAAAASAATNAVTSERRETRTTG